MRAHIRGLLAASATLVSASGLVAAIPAGAADASGSPITIALVTSLTGPGASQFSTAPAGFIARIDAQNAQGGVNGHKLVPLVVDDQTTNATSAVQDAISKGAFGIVSDSPLFYSAAKYPQQQGLPVTGGYFDGPEWGEQPYTNMFSSDNGSVDPKYPDNLNVALFMKQHGGTVIGTYGYSVSASSTRAAKGVAAAFQHYGGKVGVLNTSVPYGGVNFTADALVAKQNGVNAVFPSTDNNSNFALVTAFKQAGSSRRSWFFLPATTQRSSAHQRGKTYKGTTSFPSFDRSRPPTRGLSRCSRLLRSISIFRRPSSRSLAI